LAAQVVAGVRIEGAEGAKGLANAFSGIVEAAADDSLERVEAELEPRRDAEVAASAAKPPEQLGVLAITRANPRARRSYQLSGDQVVAGESVLSGEVADAAAEGEAGDPGRADHATRRNEAVRLRRGVEVEPGGAAFGD